MLLAEDVKLVGHVPTLHGERQNAFEFRGRLDAIDILEGNDLALRPRPQAVTVRPHHRYEQSAVQP